MAKETFTDFTQEVTQEVTPKAPARPLKDVHSVDLMRAGESYLNSLPQNKQDVTELIKELKYRGFVEMADAVQAESHKR